MKNKIYKSLISLCMALVLMVSLLLPIGQSDTKKVSAQVAGQQNLYSLNDDYDTVYYFSDDLYSSYYGTYFASVGIAFEDEIFAPNFWDGLANYGGVDSFNSIYNAYVIFEITQELPEQNISSGGEAYIEVLEDIFSTLKVHGCEIMFICPTDEMLFSDYADFLNYVDVHINTDVMTVFMTSIIHHIIEDCGDDEIENFTILLDTSFATNNIPVAMYYDIFEKFFMGYLRHIYGNSIGINGYDPMFFNQKNIYIFWCVSEETVYDMINQEQIYIGDMPSTEHIYAIGSNARVQETGEWIEMISDIRLITNNFDVYMYIPEFADILLFPPIPYLFSVSEVYDTMDIQLEFVTGQDMTSYDNWSGICDITHKTIPMGEGGWMISWTDEGHDVPSEWEIISD